MESKGYRMKIINHTRQQDHVAYLLRLFNMEKNVMVEFFERYSNLKTLHDNLKRETTSSTFPRFPPKKFFGSSDEKFLNQRQTELNTYFDSIFNDENFSQLPSLKKWVEEAIKKHSKTTVKSIEIKEPPAPKEESNSNRNTLQGNEAQKIKELVDDYSKKFINLEKKKENDFQENPEKSKEYIQVIVNEGVLKAEEPVEFAPGDDANFDLLNKDKAEIDERAEKTLKLFESLDKKFKEDLPSIYSQFNDLIVNF